MRWIDTVASYLPSLIVNHLIKRTTNEELPSRQEYDTVCLFADVSGFTALSEAMMSSSEGVEGLAKHLNSYFGQMVRIIASEGGDVFKFAGDALIVLWPPPTREALTDISIKGREKESGEREGTTPMERRVRRAAQCAFAIQESLHDAELTQEVRLSVKIGIGMGQVSVLHLGGVYKRMEYIAVGEPLLEAFTAEHHATAGDVIISMQAHKLVKDHFRNNHRFDDGYCRISKDQNYNPMRKQNKTRMLQQSLDDPLLEVKVKGYIPGAVLRNLRPDSPEDEHWSNEIRRVTVLFVNLGLKEQTLLAAAVYDEAMKEMHQVMVAVQESVYEYEGSINKFLMDDKGSTLVAVYGLPPVGHADDPTRGVLAALRMCERLFDLAKVGSVGITTGEAFCGVVGSKTRKEYTVLGDSVNLAARLMQRAVSEDGGVMCELATKRACGGLLQFKGRGDFRIKGKTAAAKVFQPYPEDFPKPDPPQYLGANVYGLIHQQQRQNYAMHKLLTSLQAYFARPAVKEISSSSSPTSEQRTRYSGSQRGSMNLRGGSMTSVPGGNMGENGEEEEGGKEEEEEEEEVEDLLVGLGGHHSDSSEGSEVDVLDVIDTHSELQYPGIPSGAKLPFQTGLLSAGMDGDIPFEGQLGPPGGGGGGGGGGVAGGGATFLSPESKEDDAAAPALDLGDMEPKKRSSPPGNPRIEMLGRSSERRDVFKSPEGDPPQDGGQPTGGGGVGGGDHVSVAAAAAAAAAAGALGVVATAQGKEPMQKSTSLTAKVFASGSGVRSSVASTARSSAASATGTSFSGGGGGGGGNGNASPDTLSPTSTSADAPHARSMGRRQGDSTRMMQKLFGKTDEGPGASSSQPTSPSSRPAPKESGDSSRSLVSGPTDDSAAAAAPPPPLSNSANSCGSNRGADGGKRRDSPLGGSKDGNAAKVMPRPTQGWGADPDGSGGGGGGDGNGSSGRKQWPDGFAESKQPITEGGQPAESAPDEMKVEQQRCEGGSNGGEGICKDGPATAAPKVQPGTFRLGPPGLPIDDDEILPPNRVGRRRRSSRRLSVSQNGMVPLPASAGIPQSDLGASGSCSLPRYSRYHKQQFGAGSVSSGLASGHGVSRSGHSQMNVSGMTQSSSGSSNAPTAPTLFNKTRRGLDDSASSSSTSFNGGPVLRAHPVSGDVYDNECRLQVVIPRGWKWSSLPAHCHRLPAININETPTFKALVDRCWEVACEEVEVKGWPQPAPSRQHMVLNILGTRVMLPTEPDYDIDLLPHFVKEASGTRGLKGFTDRKRSCPPEAGVVSGSVDLCLLPRMEILNVQSRWLNSRICLLQHKIALVGTGTGSVVLLEGLPGAGKTEVLSVFAARTMPRKALIHFTAASPYHVNKGFGGWSMVLQQYLDSLYKQEVVAGNQDFSGHGGVRRPSVPPVASGGEQANGASILGQQPLGGRDRMLLRELEGFPEMHAYAFLVNDVLGTNIPNNRQTWDTYSSASSSMNADGMNGNESDSSDFDEGTSVGHEQRVKLSILLQLVKSMAASKPRIVVIDDAQFLDKDSWTLALQIATCGPMGTPLPLMLILSFRPLLHYRAIFSHIAPDYKALTQLDHVHFLKISGAPPEEVEELVSEKLGTNVVDISDSLFGLMEELCTGNPLMITELVSHLKMMEPKQLRYIEIRSEEGDQGDSHNNIDVAVHVSLTDSFRLSGSLLPEKLNALLTSQTDRLNSCQLMALKVASLIGKEFSTWFLYEVYPIKGHKDRLLRELGELEEQGFLVEVQGAPASVVIEQEGWARPSIAAARGMSLHRSSATVGDDKSGKGGGGGSSVVVGKDSSRHLWGIPNVVYTFTHGFMMEMLQLKMLKSQTNLLKTSIQKLKDRLETQKRHEQFKNQTIDKSQKQKAGTLSVMKYKVTMSQAATNARESTRRRKNSVTSRAMQRVKRPVQQKWTEALDWKKRSCLLTGESLSLFSDPKDTEPSQIVYLKGATAEPELGQAFKDSAFRVETNKWKKGDEVVDGTERRTFTFLAESKDDKELWLYQIRHCIEVIKVLNGEEGTSNADRLMQKSSGRSSRSSRFRITDSSSLDESDNEVDSTLVVRVEQADNLILEQNFGTVYPYCLVDLDDQSQKTTAVQSASIDPSWNQDLTFQVSVQQWVLSNLRVQVWHKDLFLTDDFLGHVTIPLTDVAVQKWDDDGDAAPPELKWYDLESAGRTKRAVGRLLLGVRLFMNKPTSDRASAVGGVDKLKTLANQRMSISSHAARVGQLQQQRKQSLPGLLHHVSQASDSHHHSSHPPRHSHHHHHHPGGVLPPNQQPMLGGGGVGNPNTYIRDSIRSMENELETSGGGVARGYSFAAGGGTPARLRSVSSRGPLGMDALEGAGGGSQDGDGSRHSVEAGGGGGGGGGGGEGSGPEGDVSASVVSAGMPAPRLSSRSRRSLRGRSRGARRNTSDSSSCNGIYVTGTEVLHTDPLTRQLMLMLLAVETKAKVSMPEERGGGSVNREWIRLKLKELLTMVGRSDVDLEQLDTHTFYCKDRKENQYGPFPAKQLVEAHNAGYINDRKVLVKEARMKGEFRPMGARALMHGPSSDEAFKSLTMWPQVDAHHPLADRILSPSDGSSHDFREWGFNIFGLDKQELGMLAATVLAETGLPRTFGISMKTFAHFMSAVGFFMGRNPRVSYHNLYHAVDVMHATYLTLDGMGASGLLTVTEQLALILSALCHDLDHPGLTNSFQMATESPLASLYNDQAPLEHHHLAIMFQILRREGCDILGHLEKPQRTRIREVMIQGILATEMSEHGTHISKVDKLTNDFPSITLRVGGWASGDIGRGTDRSNPGPLLSPPQPGGGGGGGKEALGMSFSSMGPPSMRGGPRMGPRALLQVPGAEAAALGLADSDRLAVASALLHAADLSSPGRPFATCKVWVLRLLEEFKFQAEQERQRGLRVTVLEGPPSASQPGFIDAFLLPFFTALLPIAPGLADEYIPNLQDNRNQWAAIAEQEAQLASPDRSSNVDKAGDRSSTGSVTSTGPGSAGGGGSGGGVGRRNSGGADSNGNGGGGSGLPPPPPPQLSGSSSSPTTFDGQRRYSGGAIGIASMLGSLGTVPTGRSISDGSIDRRVSSIISTSPGVPPEFPGLRDGSAGASAGGGGGGAAWRRQSAMGPATGAGPEFGYPMWRGGAVRGASVPLGGAGWGERTAGDGEIVSEATAAAKAQGIPPAPAAAGSATGWTIDVGGGGVAGEVKAEEADSEEQQQGGGEERPEGGVEGQALPEALPE